MASTSRNPTPAHWHAEAGADGIRLRQVLGEGGSALLSGFVSQLLDDGLAQAVEDAAAGAEVRLSWTAFYDALSQTGYQGLAQALHLPPQTQARISLASQGALTDVDFQIVVAGWRQAGGGIRQAQYVGALVRFGGQIELMTEAQWALVSEVQAFARRSPAERTGECHRRGWASIRSVAIRAKAELDSFLASTVVLTPQALELAMRRSQVVQHDLVVEVIPGFDGVPANWLKQFDRLSSVQDRYDVVTAEGIVQVLVSPQIKSVLEEIKRMPGRRVAGARSEAFVLNPYAALGSDATAVIDEEQFSRARVNAGLVIERFVPIRGEGAHAAGLEITTIGSDGQASTRMEWLTAAKVDTFMNRLRQAIKQQRKLLAWEGYQLELDADSLQHLYQLQAWQRIGRSAEIVISHDRVYDITRYGPRIEGIGVETPLYSAYIAKKEEGEAWFPENIQTIISVAQDLGGPPVMIPVSPEQRQLLAREVEQAEQTGRDAVSVPGVPEPLPIREAKALLGAFDSVLNLAAGSEFAPAESHDHSERARRQRVALLLKENVESISYEERRKRLSESGTQPRIPSAIGAGVSLLEHQKFGLAWLQHLYRLRGECRVRGGLLADDMGLGKTFQLLAFMAGIVEQEPEVSPMLVVAPVSLLANWAEEVGKFFVPGTFRVLTAYGSSLTALRVPRTQVDQRLREDDGLVHFLKPDWVGNSNLVLTTYETLRDLEFSFASQRWSVMVCDEAQKIKNPAAMVTRAAKKQNAGFRIACTGTPVENTLADLWSLFDFVQPGLLGALNDFGKQYRRPIEAKTEEEQERVRALKDVIAPQILRRMKADVATDLPKRIEVTHCRQLSLSDSQRTLYAGAVAAFRRRGVDGGASPFVNALSLLHYLRLICSHPVPFGQTMFRPEPVADYRRKAPKLDWLLKQLNEIRAANEKAIVFCEFRELQRLLQHYIQEAFPDLAVDIINGETTTDDKAMHSRQNRLRRFQERPGFGVVILSPLAVGFGVNIQKANHVIHYTRTWNPAKEDQATDRAYRIGQTRDVYVYYPVVRAPDFPTFEERLDQLLSRKRELAVEMLNGSGDVLPGDFDIADVVPEGDAADFRRPVEVDQVRSMEPRRVEGLVAALWAQQGYGLCYCTARSGDQGVDVVAISGNEGALVQVKTSGVEGAQLGWDAVKEVVAGRAYYGRQHPGVTFRLVAVTPRHFNAMAREQARLNEVELVDGDGLGTLLERFPVTDQDINRMLYSSWSE